MSVDFPAALGADSHRLHAVLMLAYTTLNFLVLFSGSMFRVQTRRSSFGVVSTSISCSACGGTGESGNPPCESCEGEGMVTKDVSLKVGSAAGDSCGI